MNIKSITIMYRIKLLVMFLVVVGLSSCDLLENQEPQQSLPFDGDLETLSDFESALIGAYDNVQEFSNGDNSGQLAFAGDIMTNDAVWEGSFTTYVEISAQAMSAANGSIAGQWNGAYEAINASNIILANLENLEADQAVIDDIRGQAHFIRGMQYYYLVQYFAKPWGATQDNSHLGVPLQLDPITSQDDFAEPLRSSVADVYDQIDADLTQAQGLISNTTPNQGTSGAATGFLARIALIQGEWTDAADLAGDVINDYSYELNGGVTDYFTDELSAESIFEIQHTTQDVPDPANTSLTAVYNEGTRDDIQISQEYVDALDAIITEDQETALENADESAVDTRRTQLITDGDPDTEGFQVVAGVSNTDKYEDLINSADNVPIMRLPEMMLTRAEALTRDAATLADVPQEAFDLVNQIRSRAITVTDQDGNPGDQTLIHYERTDFADKQEFIDAILLERRVELSFEGHRKTDLQRNQMDVAGTAWDAPELVFPIPQSQMDANPDLTQNDGY
jgi:hypothetical protein